MNIKSTVSNDNEKFKKAFGRLWGCSGGWASATCTHGVVYALKFVLRSESPRDYVDILMSMKHQPNITILDVANMVAAHGNNRKENMFHPHSGKVVESTPDNIAKGKNGSKKSRIRPIQKWPIQSQEAKSTFACLIGCTRQM